MNARAVDGPRWRRLRFALGVAQMAGAALAMALLMASGITRVTLFATALTSLVTAASLLLFGRHRSRR